MVVPVPVGRVVGGAVVSPPGLGAGVIGAAARWTGGAAGAAPAEGEGDGVGAGVAVPPMGGVPVPDAGSVAGRDSARRTGASPCAVFDGVPDVGATGTTGVLVLDSGRGTARCTGSPAEAGRSGCAAARRGAGASVPAGGVVPPSVRRTARCTGGVEAVAPLPAGADAGPSPGRTAGRRAGVVDVGPPP